MMSSHLDLTELSKNMVVALGVPFDEYSSFLRGAASAPKLIRQALHCGSANLCSESGYDLGEDAFWHDIGDLSLSTGLVALKEIEQSLDQLLERDLRVLSLGGDHSITYPIMRAYGRKYPRLNILHLDAHPDLYEEFEGNRYSHACPFARIMEENLACRLVQVGIRTINPHQRKQIERFGVEVVEMRNWSPGRIFEFDDPLYLSIDMDALDPAFAPGVSHHEPGGLTSRDVINLIQSVKADIVGADIVEYNPSRDVVGMTGMLAAKFYKEIIVRMLNK